MFKIKVFVKNVEFIYLWKNLDFTIAEFEDKTNKVFLEAVENLKTEKMHQCYIEFCTERLKLDSKFLNEEVIIFNF